MPPDPASPLQPQSEQSADVLERAWRNGWGSALNFLRAAENMVADQMPPGAEDPAKQAIIRDLVREWVKIIDGVTEDAVGKAHEIGFAAVPSREASGG